MSTAKSDRDAARASAAARRNDELIARAARRVDWATTALDRAAEDLDRAHDGTGRVLTDLAAVVLKEARRVSVLVEDIENHRPVPGDDPRPHDRAAER
jgi:hypothetical protein